MAAAAAGTVAVPISVASGCNQIKSCRALSGACIVPRRTLKSSRKPRKLSVHARYSDRGNGFGADFVAGFFLGGAVFGTLAYLFAPQIRRSVLNEDEYGFRRAKRLNYYDEGLEKTRQTLNEKISQLNSAIDNVSSRLLRGGGGNGSSSIATDQVPIEDDAPIS
ncbi:hypothetical protein M569_08119 [Genlisea aurea]|uniref:Uncharacterized protein n=1 Tax=Genlisea aurea TaxID=192259 RepID=S8E310_9LAMI|nr:hypothetical protein M569_08119 [Genlisea aurea]